MILKDIKDVSTFFTLKNAGLEDLFKKTAYKLDFKAEFIDKIIINEIPKIILPAILLLKDNKACILTEFSKDLNKIKIIAGEDRSTETYWVDANIMQDNFTNKIFILTRITPTAKYDSKKKEHWFWSSLKYSKSIYFDVLIASFLINIFILATPLFTMNIYDRVIPILAFDTLWFLSLGIFIIYIFDALMKFFRIYILELASKKSDILISSKIFSYILKIKLSYKFTSVGSFASHLKEFESIRTFLSSSSISLLIDIPFIAIFLFVMFIIAGNIIIIPIISILLIILYTFIVKSKLTKSIKNISNIISYKNSILIESLTSLETIKSFRIGNKIKWKWEDALGKIAKEELKYKLLSTSITSWSSFLIQSTTVGILIFGVYKIGENSLTMGGLIAIVMLSSRALAPLNQLTSLVSNYEQAKNSYDILNKIMKLPIDETEDNNFVSREKIEGKIEFKNIRFKYPKSNSYILDNVSFVINSGEKVGIIGLNGSGKSTILKLILGIYEPESGSILIDDINIKQFNPNDLKRFIGYIPQNITLFRGTLKDNIIDVSDNGTDEDLIKASDMSGISNFIRFHQSGFNMLIQEYGNGLSGGQKQGIGVARAFIKKKSNIILADELTSFMDNNMESKVIKNFKIFSYDKTVIITSHKQIVLKLTDRLILIKDSKKILDDKYDTVMNRLKS